MKIYYFFHSKINFDCCPLSTITVIWSMATAEFHNLWDTGTHTHANGHTHTCAALIFSASKQAATPAKRGHNALPLGSVKEMPCKILR